MHLLGDNPNEHVPMGKADTSMDEHERKGKHTSLQLGCDLVAIGRVGSGFSGLLGNTIAQEAKSHRLTACLPVTLVRKVISCAVLHVISQ